MMKQLRGIGLLGRTLANSGVQFLFLFMGALFSNPLFAQGLDDVNDEADDLRVWAYAFLGIVVFLYMIYHVIMAMADKKPWGDVLMALVHVTAAGGVIVATTYAWSVWGT